jgi:phospho-N-acetylmuramoyl-pentapeptide-transferase
LRTVFSAFNVFRYITFRSIFAILTALIISMVVGAWFIRKLRELQIGQFIREDGPQSHQAKTGTPTMGGLMIIFAILTATALWAELDNPYIWLLVLVTLGFGLIGFFDDYLKVIKKHNQGLSGRAKLVTQTLVALVPAIWLYVNPGFNTTLTVPFFKQIQPDLGLFFIPFAVFVIVGCANAVNLTDGLDGLAAGLTAIAAATFGILAYVTGRVDMSRYLGLFYLPGSGELAVFALALVGGAMGFLWYNTHPAEVFMGDTGSLALGGAIGVMAILLKAEFLLVIVGGVFVMEGVSVMVQTSWFKYTARRYGQGRRVFRMAPIHHHFEKLGWPETKVVVRFWILGILFAMVAFGSLKIR